MKNLRIPNAQQYLINGSNPSLFSEVNNEATYNLLCIEDFFAPNHGKGTSFDLINNVDKYYKSDKTKKIYIIAGNIGFEFSAPNTLKQIFTLPLKISGVSFAENVNSEIGITTGNAYYVYNYSTDKLTQIKKGDNGFTIENPNSIKMIDNIFFISDSQTSTFQATLANNATHFSTDPVQTFNFESRAGNILGLAEVNRTLFVVGDTALERWVLVPTTELLVRDNQFEPAYGLYDTASFVNKKNTIVGLFYSKEGGVECLAFSSDSEKFSPISTPGIIKKMLSLGMAVTNSDIYMIDQHLYYEIVFKDFSFIYSFSKQQWTYSTSPFEQVFFIGGLNYGCSGNQLYAITLYKNNQIKIRVCPPIILPNFERFTVSDLAVWFHNKNLEKGDVLLSAIRDGVDEIVDQKDFIDGNVYFDKATRYFNVDVFNFALKVQTKLNVLWKGLEGEIAV